MAPTAPHIDTDYLIVGAGISGLSFADELFTNTPATTTLTIVDKRDNPGGHWNDSYSFIKLHGPGTIYGVNSKKLSDNEVEQHGLNRGLLKLSSGPEIITYCSELVRERFLASGRVTYLPSTEYIESEGILRNVLDPRKRTTVHVKKKVVNASYYTNIIPLTHTPSFSIAAGVTCIPPNDLPRCAPRFPNVTVLGAGKTAIDSCLWLLNNGMPPDRIQWVIPNDYWYLNRATVQVAPQFFNQVFAATADRFNALAKGKDAREIAHLMEQCGNWLRLDERVEPANFHAGIVSVDEMSALRKIENVVRQGYVTAITASQIAFDRGTPLSTKPDTLYIDCTASAIPSRPLIPIFEPGKITLQLVFSPMGASSASVLGLIESLGLSDEECNDLVKPAPFAKLVEEFIFEAWHDLQNRYRLSQNPHTRNWIRTSRLDGFGPLAATAGPDDKEKMELLARIRTNLKMAAFNLPKLIANTEAKGHL